VQERLVEGLGPFITLLVEIFLFVEVYVHFHFTACADSLHATLQEY
jgi:hypothetical protein